MSFLIRKETSDNDEVAVKLAESDIAWNAQNTDIEIGYFGDIYSMENGVKQWTLNVHA